MASPADLRRELHDLIVADLLGPAGGERETLTDPRERVSARYLVGMLAPRGTVATDPERQDDPGVDGDDAVRDPSERSEIVAQPTLFASSFGCTCAVVATATHLRVRATWGKYLKEEKEDASGRVWQRHPMKGEAIVELREGIIEPAELTDEARGVRVRGRCARREGAWLVSLFWSTSRRPRRRTRMKPGCSSLR